ncbi:YibE/F family protein [Lactiplantibacillus paraplantarum]|uniref:YibE/F family protein n=1 Tax=Lactiplantibacillus paraplantarum TaxID=60520 RepID=A0A4Q9Y2Q4_9LACO|nr:YibE/F family protein [Lactiplantibacillus paraplantarum]TBX49305.1 YibE/F family protein [Lactiplantibacillus paraplantarum]
MNTITVLGLILLGLMTLIGGKTGATAFLSLLFNFGLLFLAVVLISWGFPAVAVSLVIGTIILAFTIFFGEANEVAAKPAYIAALIVMVILVLIIFPVENWIMAQGFSLEDSEDLEGMSLAIGVSFIGVAVTEAILSTLGAIAEAAIAIAAGLSEILAQHPQLSTKRLYIDGISIGKQIIGTTFNTLFFGFFGGFLALFIWFSGLHYSFGSVINNKIFVAEVLMVLFSLMGVILVVPVTTWVMTVQHRQQIKHND